jgi:hypothetical protein
MHSRRLALMAMSRPGLAIFTYEIDSPSEFLPWLVNFTEATSNAADGAADWAAHG